MKISGTWLAGLLCVLLPQAGLSATLQESIERSASDGKLLSAVVVTRSADEEEYFGFGTVQADSSDGPDTETVYQIGSITKALTNLLLAELVATGQVEYSTTVAEILDDEVSFANPEVGQITLLDLATHTSGLPRLPANLGATDLTDPYALFDEAMLLQALSSSRALQPLGDHYGYSNFGSGLLGYLLGRVHGGGYQTAMNEMVLAPLGMTRTGIDAPAAPADAFSGGEIIPAWSFEALAGAGALWSDAQDLMRLATLAMNDDQWPLVQAINTQRQMLDVYAGEFTLTPVWHTVETPSGTLFWHNGATAGHRSFLGFRPETDEAIVLLISGDVDPTPLGMEWFGPRTTAEQSDRAQQDAQSRQIVGQYELNPTMGIGIYKLDGALVAQLTGQAPAQLFQIDSLTYALHIADATVRFVRDEASIVAVELIQNGMVQRAKKTADEANVLSLREINLSSEELDAYVGRYQLAPGAVFTIRATPEGLEAQLTGQPFLRIFPKAADVFFYKAVDAELHFKRSGTDDVTGLVLHQGNRELPAQRI